MKTHGHYGSPTYKCWQQMRARCGRVNSKDYARYGGRGIRVCAVWRKSFAVFLHDMGVRPEGHTLGRKDNDKSYCKKNCRWETPAQQALNRSSNRFLRFRGKRLTVAEWSRETKLSKSTILGRLDKHGWSTRRALATPSGANPFRPKITFRLTINGVTRSALSWSRTSGVNYRTIWRRVKDLGWSHARAIQNL